MKVAYKSSKSRREVRAYRRLPCCQNVRHVVDRRLSALARATIQSGPVQLERDAEAMYGPH